MYATKNEILIIQLWNAICIKVTSLYTDLLRKSTYLFFFDLCQFGKSHKNRLMKS